MITILEFDLVYLKTLDFFRTSGKRNKKDDVNEQ